MEPQELATKCLSYIKNVDGTEHSEYRYTQTEDAPDWFGDVVYAAHLGLCPNAWSYRFIRNALLLCENCDTEDGPQVDIDSEYPYTRDRLNWFASSLERPDWCDKHSEEFGNSGATVLGAVASGMWYELDSVAQLVWRELVKQCEQQEEPAEVE